MALLDKLRFAVARVVGLFWGCMVALQCLRLIVTKREKFFAKRDRSVAPSCLTNPELGQHSYTQVTVGSPSVKLHYVISGPDDGQLLLMLHGFPEFWYSWRHQIKEFRTKYRVVAVDMRGYGDSSKPVGVENYRLENIEDDIKRLIESLGRGKPCVLMGHDWGGIITWRVTSRFPELVERAVVMNCPHPQAMDKLMWSSFKQFLKSWYIFFFSLPYFPEWFLSTGDLRMLDNAFCGSTLGAQPGAITTQDMEAYKHAFNKSSDFTGPINYYRAVIAAGSFVGNPKGQIQTPMLLVWGTRDEALSRQLAELSREYVRDLRVDYVDGASHWVQQDEPEIVNKKVWEFLK